MVCQKSSPCPPRILPHSQFLLLWLPDLLHIRPAGTHQLPQNCPDPTKLDWIRSSARQHPYFWSPPPGLESPGDLMVTVPNSCINSGSGEHGPLSPPSDRVETIPDRRRHSTFGTTTSFQLPISPWIEFTTSFSSTDSSAPLFTQGSSSDDRRSDGTITKSIIAL